ncbi:MAG: twin transmembrane helix small protein [Gammaproteobacteria bacterium]|nr:twin transmembrane helix small protein [Gammaproteobacteria bacterium]
MTPLTITVILALLATIGAFVTGIYSMIHGGAFDEKHGTEFMAARVGFQGLTVVLMLLALYFAAA